MNRLYVAGLLASARRAATLAASEPDEARAGELVDAGTEAILSAHAAADGTAFATAVEREGRAIAERLAAVAERRLAA